MWLVRGVAVAGIVLAIAVIRAAFGIQPVVGVGVAWASPAIPLALVLTHDRLRDRAV